MTNGPDDAINELSRTLNKLIIGRRPSPPKTLNHYTTAEGLAGIIGSGNLRASSAYHLNDSSEFVYGLELAEDVLIRLRDGEKDPNRSSFIEQARVSLMGQKELLDLYLTCFCQDGNLLSMWRSYGSRGYCLGLRSDLVASLADPPMSLVRVEYDRSRQGDLVERLVDAALPLHDQFRKATIGTDKLKAMVAYTIMTALPSFKNPAFREEEEWRIVKVTGAGLVSDRVSFRSVGGLLVPFIDLDIFQDKRDGTGFRWKSLDTGRQCRDLRQKNRFGCCCLVKAMIFAV